MVSRAPRRQPSPGAAAALAPHALLFGGHTTQAFVATRRGERKGVPRPSGLAWGRSTPACKANTACNRRHPRGMARNSTTTHEAPLRRRVWHTRHREGTLGRHGRARGRAWLLADAQALGRAARRLGTCSCPRLARTPLPSGNEGHCAHARTFERGDHCRARDRRRGRRWTAQWQHAEGVPAKGAGGWCWFWFSDRRH